jgi:D-arginine dehydrogenase
MHTIVIGGGIAGLSVAWQLARTRRVTLLERETFVGTHSSARNAQIWLPIDDDETTGPLARRSAELFDTLSDSWLARGTAIVIGAPLDVMERGARRGDLGVREIDAHELAERSPMVRTDEPAILVERAGIFDPHRMIGALERACRDSGVSIVRDATVEHIVVNGRVRGVALADRGIDGDEVVLAAGAWSGALGDAIGANVPLVPLRRHLVILEADPARAGTTVWRFGPSQVYFRPEAGGVLASPCDEEPFLPCLPPSDPAALEALAVALDPIAPELADAKVRSKWACLRTYTHDRELVVGPDPRVEGLSWLAGFGGRGMTGALAAAELCARAMDGGEVPAIMRADRVYPASLAPP